MDVTKGYQIVELDRVLCAGAFNMRIVNMCYCYSNHIFQTVAPTKMFNAYSKGILTIKWLLTVLIITMLLLLVMLCKYF